MSLVAQMLGCIKLQYRRKVEIQLFATLALVTVQKFGSALIFLKRLKRHQVQKYRLNLNQYWYSIIGSWPKKLANKKGDFIMHFDGSQS